MWAFLFIWSALWALVFYIGPTAAGAPLLIILFLSTVLLGAVLVGWLRER